MLADIGLDSKIEGQAESPGICTTADQPLVRHSFSTGYGGILAHLRTGLLQYVLKAPTRSSGSLHGADLARLMGPPAIRDPDAALPLARRAVDLAPGDPLCRSTLGVAYARLGRWSDALAELHGHRTAEQGPPPRIFSSRPSAYVSSARQRSPAAAFAGRPRPSGGGPDRS